MIKMKMRTMVIVVDYIQYVTKHKYDILHKLQITVTVKVSD